MSDDSAALHVKVRHRNRLPKPYKWEIYRGNDPACIKRAMHGYPTQQAADNASVEKNVRATWHYSAMTEIPEFAALLEEIVGSQHHRSFSVDWPFEELRRYSLLNPRIARRLQV